MTMTRQHFALIAEVLRDHVFDRESELTDNYERKSIASSFASALASTNPNFNRTRFLRACGVDDA